MGWLVPMIGARLERRPERPGGAPDRASDQAPQIPQQESGRERADHRRQH
jgi:hypothetical protein